MQIGFATQDDFLRVKGKKEKKNPLRGFFLQNENLLEANCNNLDDG